ncbi:transcriptional regulator [Rhizobium sp. Leaf384]|uniref:helix-turn-helix domain-containing protein n=1 Tax=unclassified Rhizobium TaxID=2613769 RepID=UPI0007150C02|nr:MULTISPECIES: helix-turn-helix transcriptional regulator [unclassified Rhizobium]KQS80249.1 transcriptional regulator [Rhizobium sp. Leaf384]KQS83451.1 transcriptional regulator [Rhizobium sp. Leaf383]
MRPSTDGMMAMLRQPHDTDTAGGRLFRARGALNLSLDDLAERLGVPPDTVSDWERDRSAPEGETLALLADLLGVTSLWLTAGIAEPSGVTLSPSAAQALIEELASARRLHTQAGKAIDALETSLRRALKGI